MGDVNYENTSDYQKKFEIGSSYRSRRKDARESR